ncbi:hypothetical protein Vafri_9620, partial [Volvox africanus]
GAGADGGAVTHLARGMVDAVASEGSGDGGATGAASAIAAEATDRSAPASDVGHGGEVVASGADVATAAGTRVSPGAASAAAAAAVEKPECVAGDYRPPASLAPEPQPRTSVQLKGMEAVEVAVAEENPYEETEAAPFSSLEGTGEDSVLVEVGALPPPPPPPPSSSASEEAAPRGSCSLGAELRGSSLPLE